MSSDAEALAAAIGRLAAGGAVLVVDDEQNPQSGDVCVAAERIVDHHVSFMAAEARGLVCLAMLPADMARLGIPLLPPDRSSERAPAYGTSFEARFGVSTGISAADRAHTIRVAVDPASGSSQIVMPGHVPPIQCVPGGVLEHTGSAETMVDLVRLAGQRPAAVGCTVLDGEGNVASGAVLLGFARAHGLPVIDIRAVVRHRLRSELLVERLAETELESDYGGSWRAIAYRNRIDDSEHLALVRGRIDGSTPLLVRVHSQCLTGDVLGSRRCDCGDQLQAAMARIAREGSGVLVYLHQEGRGIGLANKIRAYALQDEGLDTVEANLELGFQDDQRDYGISAQILRDLGVHRVRLLTNNERKIEGLSGYGLGIEERVPLEVEAHEDNIGYLRVKQRKLGHLLSGLDRKTGEES